MAEKIYLVRDNGLRCFVAPCFSWDIVDGDSQKVSVASALDLSKLGLSAEQTAQVMGALTKGQLHVKGYLVGYEVKISDDLPPSEGIRFVVVQIVGEANP
ncbi:MAG TPA: hypothetical protein PKE45_21630 [Caldilineaceae bacterium]|nr:hypothetical protein [Caldilineaceae bacterium]